MSRSPSQQIVSDSKSVKEIFRSGFFEIPLNQREYSWEKDQLEKLWDDLVFTVRSSSNHSIGHFLGAVVIIGRNSSHNEDRWSVIDGQQRLTTLTILAEALLFFVEKYIKDRRTSAYLTTSLQSCVYDIGREGVFIPRIVLNRGNEFYKHAILDHAGIDEKNNFFTKNAEQGNRVHQKLIYAINFFYEKISSLLNEQANQEETIKEFATVFVEDFYFLVVRTEELWMGYRLFETLNERGLDLSQADLIKNVLLQSSRESGQNVVKIVSDSWNQLVANYESQSETKLELPQIIQFSFTCRDSLVKKDDIFDRISKCLRSNLYAPNELAGFFEEDSRYWCNFLTGDLNTWSLNLQDSQNAILSPLWKIHCAPFIMAVMKKYSDDIPSLEKCFLLCEHYLFRQGLICNDSVNSLQEFFAKAALKVRVASDVKELVELFRSKSSNELFVEAFASASVKNMKQAFYVLWKIENHELSELNFRPCTQSAAQHVEHIMPRRPDYSWNRIEENEFFNIYLNKIGNLLILPAEINRHIKNKSLSEKMSSTTSKDYNHSKLRLPHEFCEKYEEWTDGKEWGFDGITQRQKFLAEKYAAKVWCLDIAY